MVCCRGALRHSSMGKKIEQAAKTTWTINRNTFGPRDLIAYGGLIPFTRKRSFHSSSIVGAKGNSMSNLDNNALSTSTQSSLGKTKTDLSVKPTLANITELKLNGLSTHDNKYNKIVPLLVADPFYLIECYNNIRGKPGNMIKGANSTTLDGINLEWFEKTALKLKSGTFDFNPSRRVEIPKPNSDKKRPLTIASPRDKIVQKALETIIEAIWEKRFLDSSHGKRPGRSVHSALAQIYHGSPNYI